MGRVTGDVSSVAVAGLRGGGAIYLVAEHVATEGHEIVSTVCGTPKASLRILSTAAIESVLRLVLNHWVEPDRNLDVFGLSCSHRLDSIEIKSRAYIKE